MTATQIAKAVASRPAKINSRSRKEWAALINADWRKSVDRIIGVGRDLIAAKDELDHGEFSSMCRDDLVFSQHAAERLMKIANHPEITKSTTSQILPASWTVLSELSRLTSADFKAGVKAGIIGGDTTVRSARAYADAAQTDAGEVVGRRGAPMLPKPSEARTIARETGRGVAASDGHTYFGASKEEEEGTARARELIYGVRRAISDLAGMGIQPNELLDLAQDWQGWRFDEAHEIVTALEWLQELKDEWETRNGPIARQH